MPVMLAIIAATVFGTGVALQRRVALDTEPDLSLRPGLFAELLRHPLWVLGFGAEIVAFGFQTAALRHGSLVLIQPILATPLVIALILGSWWWGEAVHHRDWLAVAAVTAGLALFLVVTQPSDTSVGVASRGDWVAVVGLLVVGVGAATLVGSRLEGVARAAALGLAAGGADAVMAVLTKAFSAQLEQGVAATARSWTPYAVIVAGIAAVLLTQSAYQAGHPTVALPVITVVDPFVSSVVGVSLFAERLMLGGARAPLALLAAGVVVGGLVVLCRNQGLTVGVTPEVSTWP